MSGYPNYYAPLPNPALNLIAHRRRSPSYHSDLSWPGATVFTGQPVPCGPIQDAYCPSRVGVVGGHDIYGFPMCVCPVSMSGHTWPIIPVGDPAAAVELFPIGPFLL